MNKNLRMEQLSKAYVRAVATQAGWTVIDSIYPDTDSIDGELRSDIGDRPRIEYQLKSTADDIMRDDGLHYPLRIKNYKDLRIVKPTVPRILIVMWMPKNETDRFNQTNAKLCMRHCCYWKSLEGEPPTQNTSTITVILDNIFDTQLDKLWDKINS